MVNKKKIGSIGLKLYEITSVVYLVLMVIMSFFAITGNWEITIVFGIGWIVSAVFWFTLFGFSSTFTDWSVYG